MKTTLDYVNIVYNTLVAAGIPAQISGSIYKVRRPRSTRTEDVVIIPLVLQTQDQRVVNGILNLNVHVPNLDIDGSGQQYADTARMLALGQLITAAIDSTYGVDYYLTVSHQLVYPEDQENEHFLNIRIQALLIN